MPEAKIVDRPVPGIGHNRPLEEFDRLDPDQLKERLGHQFDGLAVRLIELEQAVERTPPVVKDEQAAARLTDFVGEQLRPLAKQLTEAHRQEKAAYLACGRVCDDYFLARGRRVARAIETIERRVQVFHAALRERRRREEEAQRRRAEEEAARAEEAARQLRAEAEKKAAAGDRQGAARAATEAEAAGERAAEQAAIVTAPSEPVRIHGDYGATGFSRGRWDYEVVDPTQIPLGYLTIDHDAVKAALAQGVREIPGLRIFETERFTIRRG